MAVKVPAGTTRSTPRKHRQTARTTCPRRSTARLSSQGHHCARCRVRAPAPAAASRAAGGRTTGRGRSSARRRSAPSPRHTAPPGCRRDWSGRPRTGWPASARWSGCRTSVAVSSVAASRKTRQNAAARPGPMSGQRDPPEDRAARHAERVADLLEPDRRACHRGPDRDRRPWGRTSRRRSAPGAAPSGRGGPQVVLGEVGEAQGDDQARARPAPACWCARGSVTSPPGEADREQRDRQRGDGGDARRRAAE